MPPDKKKELMEEIKDRFHSFFSPLDPQKKKDALPPKTHFSIWYFMIALLFFTYLQQYYFSRKVETIPYGQFKQALANGNVDKLTIGPGKYQRNARRERKEDEPAVHYNSGG